MFVTQVTVLNASNPDAASKVFRPWDQRLARDVEPLHSDEDDPEMLITIPFTSDVKVRSSYPPEQLSLFKPPCIPSPAGSVRKPVRLFRDCYVEVLWRASNGSELIRRI
eukprot:1181273-Prorocentrum_minimum.AAC.2